MHNFSQWDPTKSNSESKVKIVSWNIRGISDKLADPDLQQVLFKNDIVVLYETMKYGDYDVSIPGYTFHHFARKQIHPKAHSASDGIGLFISNRISDGAKVFSSNEILVWIKLCSKHLNVARGVYIGCVYLPPKGSTYAIQSTFSSFLYSFAFSSKCSMQ